MGTLLNRRYMQDRLRAKLDEPGRQERYEKWLRNPDTIEHVQMLRDVFCKPPDSTSLTGEEAIRCMGFIEGSWAAIETLLNFSMPEPIQAEPVMDYGVDEEAKKEKEGVA